tara:strand:+ start:588 stop:779 length:192 start_codon:yes stop_codon:yes gene_type:complete
MSEGQRYGGLTSVVLKKIMGELGITQEMVDKIKSIVDNIDVQQSDESTTIQIKTKNITVVIDK